MNTTGHPEREIHFCIDSVLDGNFRPAQPKHREREMKSLFLAARSARNLVITGLPGTGKTAVIRTVLDELRQEKTPLFPVYVNARMHSSRYMIFSEIYVQLSGSGEYPVNQSFQKLEKTVWRLVSRHGYKLLVCLDDACFLSGRNILNHSLHSLLKFGELHRDSSVTVWLVTGDPGFDTTSCMDMSVLPLFSPAEVYFRPYDRDEMKDILAERIGPAMDTGMLSGDAFELIVDSACMTGDPRTGIGLFHSSAFDAAMQECPAVTAGIIRSNMGSAAVVRQRMVLDSLPPLEKEIYGIIKELSDTGMEMAMTPVFGQVRDRRDIGYTLFYRAVNRLEDAGLLRTDFQNGRSRGRKRLIEVKKSDQI